MTTLTVLGASALGFVLFVLFLVAAFQKFYIVPSADETLVKTGGKVPTVHTGGVFVIPLLHRVKRMSTRAVQVPITRRGPDALPTADGIPAEILGELIVQIDPANPDHVILAAQSLGTDDHRTSMSDVIEGQIKSLVEDALRTAVFRKTFMALQAEKKDLAEEVLKHLQEDLLKLGLTLKAVTIPHVAQGQFTAGADDVIAAMGRKNVAATVAENEQKTNAIKQAAAVQIRQQNLDSRQQQLEIERQQKQFEAEQARQVAEYEATKATEARKAVLSQEQAKQVAEAEQQKAVQTAQIAQTQEVEAAQIAQRQTLAVQRAAADAAQKKAEEEAARVKQGAEIARQRAVEADTIAKEQAIRVADEQRQQAVAEAEIAKQIAVASKKTEEADARAIQADAEAKQQRAEQAIVTVRHVADADRQRQVVAIKAEEEATKDRVAADRDAYVTTKRAEAERDAATKRAEARVVEAEGASRSQTVEAEGYAANLLTRSAAEATAAVQQADAKVKLAAATEAEGMARAAAAQALVEAENAISRERLFRDVALAAIEQAPAVVREIMAPIAAVSDVKIIQVNGLGGGDGQATVPGTILGTGMALSGALPIIREAVQGLVGNDDVKAVTATLRDLGLAALRDTAQAARGEGGTPPQIESK